MPRGFQQKALLRIHEIRFTRAYPKEAWIEHSDVMLQKPGLFGEHLSWSFRVWVEVILDIPSIQRHRAQSIFRILDEFPKGRKITPAWKVTSHPHYRDWLGLRA